MEKTYDIRNIYVATIAKQGEVQEYIHHVTGIDIHTYDWNYGNESKLGLFVKTLGGYKHILTGTNYKIANRKTAGQFVIKPNEIYEVCKYDKDIAKFLIQSNKSYRITLRQIDYLEDRFNSELNEDDELHDELNV